jgi:hypothetical protein
VANIALYPVGGSVQSYVLNSAPINDPGETSIAGSVREQDLTPTFKQSVEGVGSVTDTPPTAEAAWRDFSGTLGLYRQSDSPGDLTRPFICDADNTRPGQMTAWLQWPGGATVAIDNGTNGQAPQVMQGLVDDPVAVGFVAATNAGVCYYWRWNGTKFALQRAVQGGLAGPPITQRLGNQTPFLYGPMPAPPVMPTDTSLWAAGGAGGFYDLAAAPVAGVGGTVIGSFVYFDILFAYNCTGGNIVITPYRPRTPATGNILNSVTYTGLTPASLTIPGEATCFGAVPCEGAVYIVTDRSVYGFQWNDLTNTMLSTKLLTVSRITGAPVVWNGEVYIPADNRIIHIVPGQRGFDWRMPNPAGTLPPPYSLPIWQLATTSDALFALTAAGNVSAPWSILRMDSDGIWTILHNDQTNAPQTPVFVVQDGTNPTAIGWMNQAGTATLLPVPVTGRNPRTLAVSQRPQRPGPFRVITPWYDLESETAQKQLERFRTAVVMASATYPVKVNYQTDYADEQGADTFTTGCAKGTGTWHPCGYLGTSSTAYAGSTDANGNGALWWEFDGTTSYPNSVGVLPQYPTYKRVRWCLEINGDPTGTTVPTLLSHAFHRLEYVTKAYERDIAIRLRVAEMQGTSQRGGSVVTYANNAAIKTARDTIRALNSAKTVCTYVDEWGDNHTVVVTKYQSNLTAIDGNGLPGEYILNLSLMDVPLQGQN